MKRITLLLSLLLFAFSYSTVAQKKKVKRKGVTPMDVTKTTSAPKTDYTMDQVNGRWQEVSRWDRKTNKQVGIGDTMFLLFSNSEVYTKDGVALSMKGQALIDKGNQLVAAADIYTIKSLTDDQAVLDDGERYVHIFEKKKSFWYENLPTQTIIKEKLTVPITASLASIMGKWDVYRRDANPGSVHKDEVLVKNLNITDTKSENTASGQITVYQGETTEVLPCTITLQGEKILIGTDKYTWEMQIYKADGKEFVLGSPTLMYYSRLM